jgi:hypothetical protein
MRQRGKEKRFTGGGPGKKSPLPIPGPFPLLGLQPRVGIAETIKARSVRVLLGRPLELNQSNTPLAQKFKIELFTGSSKDALRVFGNTPFGGDFLIPATN